MKVLIVSPCGLPVPAVKGGAVLTLIESLVSQNETHKKMELTVVGSFDAEAQEVSRKYENSGFIFYKQPLWIEKADALYEKLYYILRHKLHKNPKRYLWKLYVIKKLKKLLKNKDYDAVVLQNSGYLINILRDKTIRDKYKDKVFYHIHNDIPDNIYIKGLRLCSLLVISEYLKKKIALVCGTDILTKTFVLNNGFDYKVYRQTLNENEINDLKKSLDIDVQKRILLFVGRIDPTKGIKELAEAVNSMQRNDFVLLVIGSHNFGMAQKSPFVDEMERQFALMGEKVKFTGFVPHDEVWKYYKIADMAVLPSMWNEPAGLTIVEAMSAGLPVITTNSGGIPEFIDDRFGIILERADIVPKIADAIETVLNAPEEWKTKGQNGSDYISDIVDEEKFYARFCELIGVE